MARLNSTWDMVIHGSANQQQGICRALFGCWVDEIGFGPGCTSKSCSHTLSFLWFADWWCSFIKEFNFVHSDCCVKIPCSDTDGPGVALTGYCRRLSIAGTDCPSTHVRSHTFAAFESQSCSTYLAIWIADYRSLKVRILRSVWCSLLHAKVRTSWSKVHWRGS